MKINAWFLDSQTERFDFGHYLELTYQKVGHNIPFIDAGLRRFYIFLISSHPACIHHAQRVSLRLNYHFIIIIFIVIIIIYIISAVRNSVKIEETLIFLGISSLFENISCNFVHVHVHVHFFQFKGRGGRPLYLKCKL